MTKNNNHLFEKNQFVLDEIKAGDSWRLFRIMAEFVEGFELLSKQDPMVSVFGSAQTNHHNGYYGKAEEFGAKLAREGITVITGGGPGIMEAANKGASEAGGKSIGVEIDLPQEKTGNAYTNQSIRVRYFFVRKVMLVKYSQAFVIFPGGFGTLDEMFEALTLIRTERILPFPIILVGSEFWEGISDWLRTRVLESGYIGASDMDLIKVTDDLDEAVAICKKSITDSTKAKWMKGEHRRKSDI